MSKVEWLLADGGMAGETFWADSAQSYLCVEHIQPFIGAKPPSYKVYEYKGYTIAYQGYLYRIGAMHQDSVNLNKLAGLIESTRLSPVSRLENYRKMEYETM